MPKYEVRLYETLMHTIEVEADDRESAIEIAYDQVMNEIGDYDYDTKSCGTADGAEVMEID